ncbi:hypothetical protein CANINC_002004 [Pichia inconspicua]|uniref:Uncharacterized protein n=1 Tax=Pichia inconspicua TaxID=52247 RepID=A0A4T0X2C2_9ASCO|nr:hypothetical protein CANINC_002004 [[Candida] inconspicua]
MRYKFGAYVKETVLKSNIDAVDKDRIIRSGEITFTELRTVCQGVKNGRSLLQCLADSVPVFTSYEKIREKESKKSPEYIALMDRLRAEASEREYRALLAERRGGISDRAGTIDAVGKYAFLEEDSRGNNDNNNNNNNNGRVAKAVKQQLATVANADTGTRALLSIAAALLVLVAEVVIFGGYVRRVEDARQRERVTPERKAVVDTVVIGGRRGGGGGGRSHKKAKVGTATAKLKKLNNFEHAGQLNHKSV